MTEYSENTMRILHTMIAIHESGKMIDVDDMIDDLMDDYGWTEQEADDALTEAEQCGAIFFGRPIGGMLS